MGAREQNQAVRVARGAEVRGLDGRKGPAGRWRGLDHLPVPALRNLLWRRQEAASDGWCVKGKGQQCTRLEGYDAEQRDHAFGVPTRMRTQTTVRGNC